MKTKNFTLAFIFNILIYGASLAETIEEKMAKYVLLNMQQDYITCYAFYKIGAEFIGFTLLLISAILIGLWSYFGKHKGILLLQIFYASAGIVGMIRWF